MEQLQTNAIKTICFKFLQELSREVCSRELSINPLELSQYNLIPQAPLAMAIAIRKILTEYHEPVGMGK